MGCIIHKSSFCLKVQNSTVLFIIILFLRTSNASSMPQGGSNTKLIDDNDTQVIKTEDNKAMRNVMVGSSPPRCEPMKYCRKCGKCEAIQVPIVGPRKSPNTRKDDISNYKPMFWKCKCGDVTFNP